MIEDLRFVLKQEPFDAREELKKQLGESYVSKGVRILQAYDGHVWFDVPFAGEYAQQPQPDKGER